MRLRQIRNGDIIPSNIERPWVMHLNGVVVTSRAIGCEIVHHTGVVHLAIRNGERILVPRLHHAPDVLLNQSEVLASLGVVVKSRPPEVVRLVPELIERLSLARE